MKTQSGFTLIEVAVVVVVVAMAAAAGYLFFVPRGAAPTQPTVANQIRPTVTPTVAPINNQQDLDAATAQVDATSLDSDLDASLSQLDKDSADF